MSNARAQLLSYDACMPWRLLRRKLLIGGGGCRTPHLGGCVVEDAKCGLVGLYGSNVDDVAAALLEHLFR